MMNLELIEEVENVCCESALVSGLGMIGHPVTAQSYSVDAIFDRQERQHALIGVP